MSPIANIKIAIPIFTKNCDRDPDPDRHFKMTGDPDLDRSFAIADIFNDIFNYWSSMIFLVKSKDSYLSHG